ncbi:GCN5-related N-acetyltransferase [Pseudarthrobacter chlorophenolicus A6]|uniref:GCN5-related N-acetyltransferase n=1 Tax=Pseudarthrobacter chlorophenolicus (strain ATCC 700700 / DSM 12829 / CIP 107037 / JCM 12360 / KCTC 9906 / NCIMB 13794 / A6) TaxID=452863 RepID=B8H7Y1_PSECP|nr:GNAT family N-acetyltransferase [Pseudarthrobacter chlorophenolicus]ACL41784.1 GCN5-related N-acetyltransferase [Pseudarthrobacter chlorophenolicus A6]SDQ58525.1 Acetyltransferase (GNAT) family protein [Pseudarthrobacter chlorophenolicus]
MQTNPRLNIRQVAWSHPVGADLRRAQQAELDARFGTADHEPGPPPSEADCAVFLVAYDKGSGQPVGCGGLRLLDASTAEIKRLYVVPYTRGSGVASSVLAALEAEAYKQGITRIKAEAGSAQADGRNFYQNSGFEPVPNFGPYIGVKHSSCYAKSINSHSAAHTAMA